jgi:protein-tyrosine-phosphatase
MYEGKPLLLVIGGSDTGRTPIAAGLLRHALGDSAIVLTAGVLSHAGESAAPEALLALEQVGIDISRHVSRPLDDTEHQQAELLLAVDRGTEMVLFTRFRNDPRVTCLPVLAEAPDVLDPHRMPLGVWISIMRQLQEQISKALPKIRQQLGIPAQELQPLGTPEPGEFIPLTGGGPRWDKDDDMQRLLKLIEDGQSQQADVASSAASNGAGQAPSAEPAPVVEAAPAIEHDHAAADPGATYDEQTVEIQAEAPVSPSSRAEHVARLRKLLEAASEVPEIIDWQRLRHQLIQRLRAIAQQSAGPSDFAPAAALMIEGKLAQHATLPSAEALFLLQRSVTRLGVAVSGADLATIGGELAQW